MSHGFVTNQNEKLSFREIILAHLKKILSMSTEEFHGGYKKTVSRGSLISKEYVPNARKAYCQAVEHLAYCLIPHYDDEMTRLFEEFLSEKNKQKKKYGTEMQGVSHALTGSTQDQLYTLKRLELCEQLFIQLNRLLQRKDYLNTTAFGESTEEEEFVDNDLEAVE